MLSTNLETLTSDAPPTDGMSLSGLEQDLLARVWDVARGITERVRKALGDDHPGLPPDLGAKLTRA